MPNLLTPVISPILPLVGPASCLRGTALFLGVLGLAASGLTAERAKGEIDPPTDNAGRSTPQVLQAVEVTGQRVSGLINEGVIPRQENQALNYIVLDRVELEATGATDINEAFRVLPQVSFHRLESQTLVNQQGFSATGTLTPTSRVDLRGFGSLGTTFLVNGRRMPLVRENQVTGGGPDFSRIPLSAIERIEILPGSAGGIYGTNSMGGVVNIILRKEYTGRQLTLSYGRAQAGGADEIGLTYNEGRTLLGGRANLTWTLDARDRQAMYYRARPLYRRYLDYNVPPNKGGDLLNWINTGGMVNFPSMPAVVVGRTLTGYEPLNVPGATTPVNYATAPANQTGAGLTPASFLPTANTLYPTDVYGEFALYNPSRSTSLNATFNHELIKDRLSWYAELGFGHTEMKADVPPIPFSLTFQANDPRNPFRTGVVPGYPGQRVRVFFYPADLPDTSLHTVNATIRTVFGFNGKLRLLGHDWKWALDGSSDYNDRQGFAYTQQIVNAWSGATPTNAAAANFYSPFGDPINRPNTAAADLLRNATYRINDDRVWLGAGVIRLNGTVRDLPAGPLALSLLGEYQSQNYRNTFVNTADPKVVAALDLTSLWQQVFELRTPSNRSRATAYGGLETVVPVLGKFWKLPGVHSFEIVASGTRTKITDARAFNAYNFGFRYSPLPSATLRVSYGSGTYPPSDLFTTPTNVTDVINSTTLDPRRGNTPIGNYSSIGGGNPDLRPEKSETWNFGLIFEPRQLKGFSANLDYGYIGKVDAPTTMTLVTLLANEAYFPDRVARANPSAAESALGWAGQIVRADVRRLNAGNIWTQYFDAGLRYRLETASAGNFYFIWRSTNTREFKTRLRLGIPITNTLDQVQSPLKFRGSGSVGWQYGNWTVTPSWSYIESYRDTLNVAVGSSFTTNLQLQYDIPARFAADRRWRNFFQGTRWTLGINNVLDAEPPYIANPGSGNFNSYYSPYDDPRGRYFYLRVRKTF